MPSKNFMRAAPALASTLIVAGILFTSTPLLAQQPAPPPIFIALPDRFPNLDARAVLVREPGREFIVLNPASATADELLIGLRLLNRVRRERGRPRAVK